MKEASVTYDIYYKPNDNWSLYKRNYRLRSPNNDELLSVAFQFHKLCERNQICICPSGQIDKRVVYDFAYLGGKRK